MDSGAKGGANRPAAPDLTGLRVAVIGAGFLAGHLIPALARRGADVTSFVRGGRASDTPGTRVVRADLSEAPAHWARSAADVVIQLATLGASIRGEEDIAAELALVANAMEATERMGAGRFVFMGSADEYGSAPAPQREDGPREPLNWYGRAKAACVDRVLERSAPFRVTVLRPFSVYGSGQPARMFIAGAVLSALAGTPFRMSLGTQVRDFVWVGDVADAVASAVAREADGVYNVGTGIGTSLIEAAERVQTLMPAFEIVRGAGIAPSDPLRLVADTAHTRRELDWIARTSLDEGLSELVRHGRAQ